MGTLSAFQDKVDLETLCGMMLNIFTRSRLDLPIGGLSLELQGIKESASATVKLSSR